MFISLINKQLFLKYNFIDNRVNYYTFELFFNSDKISS